MGAALVGIGCMAALAVAEDAGAGEEAVAGGLPVVEIDRVEPVDFAGEVFPVLKKNCLACHNATKSKAGLNLESPEMMKAGGDSGAALVPGKSAESLVFLTAAHLEEPEMPPAKNKSNARPLTPRELGLLKRWIDEGAEGEAIVGAGVEIDWRVRARAEDPILHVAVSPDGRLLACARGNRLYVYHLASGRLEGVLDDPALGRGDRGGEGTPVSHLDFVQSLAFAPNGDLVSGGFRTVKVWRRGLGEPVSTDPSRALPWPRVRAGSDAAAAGGSGGLGTVCALPDGRRIVLGEDDGRIRIVGEEEVVDLGRHGAPVRLVAPEGAVGETPVVVTVDANGEAVAWNLRDRTERRRFSLGGGSVMVGASPRGDRLVSWHPAESRASLWDLAEGAKLADLELGAAEASIHRLADQCARVEAELADIRTKERETATKALEEEVTKREGMVAAEAKATEARDGKASELAEAVAKVGELEKQLATLEAEKSGEIDQVRKALEEAGKARDGRQGELDGLERELVAATRNRELADRLVQRAEEELAHREALVAESSRRSERAASERDATAAAVEAARTSGLVDASFSRSGDTLSVIRSDGALVVFDAAGGAFLDLDAAADGPPGGWAGFNLWGEPLGLEVGPNATEGGRPLMVARSAEPSWRLETIIGRPDDPRPLVDRVSAVDVSPDGRFLVIGTGIPSRSGELLLWDLGKNEAAWSNADAHSDSIDSAAFSPDGKWVATASADRLVKVFDASNGNLVRQFEGHGSYATTVAWRADGLRLASAGTDNTVRIWEAETGRSVETRKEFSKGVNAVDFLGAGNQVVVASGDPSLRIDKEVLFNAGDYLHAAACDAGGTIVAGGGQDGVLRVWTVPEKKLVAEFGPGTKNDRSEGTD